MRLVCLLSLFGPWILQAAAQPSSDSKSTLRVDVGWGVDTTDAVNHQIFHLWRSYLADRPDSIRANPHWSEAEQAQWPHVDLTAPWLYQTANWWQRFNVTVVELRPATADSNEYVVRTLFALVDEKTGAVRPLGLARVFAVQEHGRWRLANALPRITRHWQQERVGAITFIFPATHEFSRDKAARSARFVDSLASTFDVPRPAALRYYIAGTPEQLARILGLDFAIPAIGRAYPANEIVLSGLPVYDEWYPHELAHVVLAPLVRETPWLLSEGLATWVGGSRGRDFPTLLSELATELEQRPRFTLDSILEPHSWRDSVSYTTAAVLLKMAHERGGVDAVRTLLAASDGTPDSLREAAARALAIAPSRLANEWRQAVFRYAGRSR